MAERLTDEEQLARGRYKKDGKWYTSSGYEIIDSGEGREPAAAQQPIATQPAPQLPQAAPQSYGETPTAGSYDYYEAVLQREKQREQALALQKQAGEAAIRLLEERRAAAALDADRAIRQAYISHMLSQRDLAQQLAANGYSGGMTDSAYLRLLTDYENRRGSLLEERARQLGEYDRKIADERLALRQAIAAARMKADSDTESERREAYRLTLAAQQAAEKQAAEAELQAARAARTGLSVSSKSTRRSGSSSAKTSGKKAAEPAADPVAPAAQQTTAAASQKNAQKLLKKYAKEEERAASELLNGYKTNQAKTRTLRRIAAGGYTLDS